MDKNLSLQSGSIDVKNAILTCFDFEEDLLKSLFEHKVHVTVFEDKVKSFLDPSQSVFKEEKCYNKVNMTRFNKDQVPYASFHSKLILFEFDDRLRVIVSSANLTAISWTDLSQVIWIQDFYPKKSSKRAPNEFEEDLTSFLQNCIPSKLRERGTQVFQKPIDLSFYDFSSAQVYLLASVNGRYPSENQANGFKRFAQLRTRHYPTFKFSDKAKIWVQASSIGKIWPRYLQQFYFEITGVLISQERINERFGFIYPTEKNVRQSHRGIHKAECLHMKSTTWGQSHFPRSSFYRMEGKSEEFSGCISHSKMIIVTSDYSGSIDDQTVIYFGSHNLSTSAWGREEKGGTQIAIANWELGVVFGAAHESGQQKREIVESLNIKFPPVKYQFGDVPYFADIEYK
ncbi:hypothetical protein FGO68_gene12090 [Halteria grandinella]|uniref:PLD phosphodiesterase domain-containing protein n=1 Tax=Halteria grandinella TaxID=5974 RepID=A0A8J8NQ25_HALGN|nr:hypothetical protein FGO68_gene12090 [Halteria grandinella]